MHKSIIRTFEKLKLHPSFKFMISVSKIVYTHKLDNIVKKYSNTYHSTIKMKPIDVKCVIYIDFGLEHNDKDPKFKLCDHE